MAKDPRVTRLEDLPGPKSKEELEEMKMPYEDYCRKVFDPGNEFGKPQALKGDQVDEYDYVYFHASFCGKLG